MRNRILPKELAVVYMQDDRITKHQGINFFNILDTRRKDGKTTFT
jgi:hypothetical protein